MLEPLAAPGALEGLVVAQREGGHLAEFLRDPLLAVAAFSLIGVSALWLLTYLFLVRRLDEVARERRRARTSRDPWRYPP